MSVRCSTGKVDCEQKSYINSMYLKKNGIMHDLFIFHLDLKLWYTRYYPEEQIMGGKKTQHRVIGSGLKVTRWDTGGFLKGYHLIIAIFSI